VEEQRPRSHRSWVTHNILLQLTSNNRLDNIKQLELWAGFPKDLQPPPTDGSTSTSLHLLQIILIVGSVFIGASLILLGFVIFLRKRKKKVMQKTDVEKSPSVKKDVKQPVVPVECDAEEEMTTFVPTTTRGYSSWTLRHRPHVVIPYSEIALKNKIGSGSFGTVYRAKWREATVAVKVLHDRQIQGSSLDILKGEARVMW
jgi:hypothetical protein